MSLHFENADFSGLSKAKAYQISGFTSNPQGNKLDIRVKSPFFMLTGPYQANGNMLVIPLRGNGRSNVTLENVDFTMKCLTKKTEENGKTYMKIDQWKANFQVSK